ncbi:MAG: preQ(1) synthase, partial [Planctomycetota bacterium]
DRASHFRPPTASMLRNPLMASRKPGRSARAQTPAPNPRIETFPNPSPGRDYVIRHVAPEFTSRCPVTGQPDFGTLTIDYIPDRLCVELKSLKLYLQSFRECGIFYEAVTNRILDELVSVLAPRWMQVQTDWNPRGGMRSTITAEHGRRGPVPV